MLPVFMKIAAHRNFLFDARSGAKVFFDKLKRPFGRFYFCLKAKNRCPM